MSRWTRWQFVVPRLLMCVVGIMAVHFVLGVAARIAATKSASDLVGASVDIDHARVSLTDGRVLLGGLSVSDPLAPGEPWLTADGCEIEIAAAPLLEKRTVINRARLIGVRFHDSRSATGLPFSSHFANDDANTKAAHQLATIGQPLDATVINKLESVGRTSQLCERWPAQLAALATRAAELDRQAKELEQAIAAANANPLRYDDSPSDVPSTVTSLQREFDRLNAELERLPQQLERQRRAIVAARRKDEAILREHIKTAAIDQDLINAYLLRDEASKVVNDAVTYLRYMQQVFPAKATARRSERRGEDILFSGVHPRPAIVIRNLEVQGETNASGQNVAFRGLLKNLTTSPALHDVPIQLKLSSVGSTPMEVRATIDRTRGQVRDELFVDCRDMRLVERTLGPAEPLQLKLSPCAGSLSVSLSVTKDKLSGDIQFVQKDVKITPAVTGKLSDSALSKSLTENLGEVNSLATRVSLGGTLDQPSCTLWSNLGPAVAEAMDLAAEDLADAQAHDALAEARRQVDERLASLERQIADHQSKLAAKLGNMPQRIDRIAHHQTRRERISVEQAGRRLPNNSLFR
jgi:uncharacterized protein (TIGR03545 family)